MAHVDCREASMQFEGALADLLADTDAVSEALKSHDCRKAWGRVIGAGKPLPSCQHLGASDALPTLVSLYLSIIDGECSVERDLAILRDFLQQSKGPLDLDGITVSQLLELRLDGPSHECEVASQVDVPSVSSSEVALTGVKSLQLTEFSRECLQLWVQRHGRRFRAYKIRSDKGKRRAPRVNTFKAVQANQRKGVLSLVHGTASSSTFLGFERQDFPRPERFKLSNSPAWNHELENFQKVTKRRQCQGQAERQRLTQNIRPTFPILRPGSVMRQTRKVGQPGQAECHTAHKLQPGDVVLGLTADSVSVPASCTLARPADLQKIDFKSVKNAAVVVVDNILEVERLRAGFLASDYSMLNLLVSF